MQQLATKFAESIVHPNGGEEEGAPRPQCYKQHNIFTTFIHRTGIAFQPEGCFSFVLGACVQITEEAELDGVVDVPLMMYDRCCQHLRS